MAAKMLTKFTAVLALMLLVVVPPASAQDYTSSGGATFSNAAPGPGEPLTVSGTTAAAVTVTVTIESVGSASQVRGAAVLGKTTLGSTVSDSAGNYSLTVTIPASATGEVLLSVMADGEMLGSTGYRIGGATNGGAAEQAAQAPTNDLPVTGSSSAWFVTVAAALLCVGGGLLFVARRKGTEV